MRPPFILRIRNSGLNQDGKLIEPLVDRGSKSEVVQEVKAASGHFRASQERVVGPAKRSAGYFENVICQGLHGSGQGVVGDLGESFVHMQILGTRHRRSRRINPNFKGLNHLAIHHLNGFVAALSQFWVVRHKKYRGPLLCAHAPEQFKNSICTFGVQVAGGFIGE